MTDSASGYENGASLSLGFQMVRPLNCPPIGRSGHSAVSDDTYMYVYGGYNPNEGDLMSEDDPSFDQTLQFTRQVMSDVWRFNFSTLLWTKLPSKCAPPTGASASLTMLNDWLMAYGGTAVPWRRVTSNKLCTCHKSGGTWRTVEVKMPDKEDENIPLPGYGQSITFWNGCMYLYAGAIAGDSQIYDWMSEIYRFDLKSLVWERMDKNGTEKPLGRYKQEIACHNDKIYIFGGGSKLRTLGLDVIHMYDLNKNHWTSVRSTGDPIWGYPVSRNSFACLQSGKDYYIFGGRTYDYENSHMPETYLNDVWHFCLESLEWSKFIVTLPECVCFHSAVLSPSGYAYIYGGIVGGNGDHVRSAEVWRMRIFQSSLAELCWERVLSCVTRYDPELPSKLSEYGVPARFVERVRS